MIRRAGFLPANGRRERIPPYNSKKLLALWEIGPSAQLSATQNGYGNKSPLQGGQPSTFNL
jgi:hypothetical protein